MAGNVFGNPVNDDVVRLVYPYKENITAKDRAEVALLYKTKEKRYDNVKTYVENLKNKFGWGTSTLCMVFNATGGNLTWVTSHDWEGGRVWKTPYPQFIQNGQWGGWLHVRDGVWDPSKGAVVYRGKNNDGVVRDYCLAWKTPRNELRNSVYTEVREEGHYNSPNCWSDIGTTINKKPRSSEDRWGGCYSNILIGKGSSPKMVALMTLDGIEIKYMTNRYVLPDSLDSKYQDK